MTKYAEDQGPWYREPGIWMVLTPLIVVVIVSSFMVSVAVYTKDDEVSDNYYKDGRMYDKAFSAENKASELGLTGNAVFDIEQSVVRVELNNVDINEPLTLLFSHPAKEEKDFAIRLQKSSENSYRAKIKGNFSGRWHLRLSANKGSEELWRLRGYIDFSYGATASLE